MRTAFLATVGRGRWWLAALASFLVRGGVVVLLPAIVALPTPAQVALHLDPSLTGDSPGDITPALVELAVRLLVSGALALLVSTTIGVRLEGDLVEAMAEQTTEPGSRRLRLPLGRAVLARLIVHLPTLVVVVVGGLALAGATYAELLAPSGAEALPVRVAARAPLAVTAIVATWLLGEAWGGIAIRRLAAGETLALAVGGGLVGVLRPSGLATLALTSLAVGVPLVGLWLASTQAYDRLWPLIVDRADSWAVTIALALLVATWASGLGLLGICLAFRAAAWTAEGLRTP
ncbi:MAG TPA: hypothetical protein VJ506_06260 [Candidatus Limnocylindrales bacterium]|nr:hypothetical protein [Candidatus Limnocylindrales bacterium]